MAMAEQLDFYRCELEAAQVREETLRAKLDGISDANIEYQDVYDTLHQANLGALKGLIDSGDGAAAAIAAEVAANGGQEALAYAYEQIQVCEVRTTALARELEVARATADAACAEAAASERELAQLRQQVRGLQCQAQERAKGAEQGATHAAAAELLQTQEENARLRGEAQRRKQREDQARAFAESVGAQAQAKDAELERAGKQVQSLQCQVQKQQKEAKEQGVASQRLEAAVAAISAEIADRNATVESLEAEVISLQAELQRQQVEHEATSRSYAVAKQTDEELARVGCQAKEKDKQVAEQTAKVGTLQAEVFALRRQLRQEHEEAARATREAGAKAAAKEEELLRLGSQVSALGKEIEERNKSIEALQQAEALNLRKLRQDHLHKATKPRAESAAKVGGEPEAPVVHIPCVPMEGVGACKDVEPMMDLPSTPHKNWEIFGDKACNEHDAGLRRFETESVGSNRLNELLDKRFSKKIDGREKSLLQHRRTLLGRRSNKTSGAVCLPQPPQEPAAQQLAWMLKPNAQSQPCTAPAPSLLASPVAPCAAPPPPVSSQGTAGPYTSVVGSLGRVGGTIWLPGAADSPSVLTISLPSPSPQCPRPEGALFAADRTAAMPEQGSSAARRYSHNSTQFATPKAAQRDSFASAAAMQLTPGSATVMPPAQQASPAVAVAVRARTAFAGVRTQPARAA